MIFNRDDFAKKTFGPYVPQTPAQDPAKPPFATGIPVDAQPALPSGSIGLLEKMMRIASKQEFAQVHKEHNPRLNELLSKPVSFYKANGSRETTQTSVKTHVAFLLDDSSSMHQGLEETIEGYNEQVGVVKQHAAEAGPTFYTDVRFNGEVRIKLLASSLDMMAPINTHTYVPGGSTALYDAICLTVEALLNTEGIWDPQTAVLVTIFTDGCDQYSRFFSAKHSKEVIERLEATGRWTFALIGPSASVESLAASVSVKASNVAGYDPSSNIDKRAAFSKVAVASSTYMSARSMGMTSVESLYKQDSTK